MTALEAKEDIGDQTVDAQNDVDMNSCFSQGNHAISFDQGSLITSAEGELPHGSSTPYLKLDEEITPPLPSDDISLPVENDKRTEDILDLDRPLSELSRSEF